MVPLGDIHTREFSQLLALSLIEPPFVFSVVVHLQPIEDMRCHILSKSLVTKVT